MSLAELLQKVYPPAAAGVVDRSHGTINQSSETTARGRTLLRRLPEKPQQYALVLPRQYGSDP
jgi:hypothetical protein